jgi:hypothetical protein
MTKKKDEIKIIRANQDADHIIPLSLNHIYVQHHVLEVQFNFRTDNLKATKLPPVLGEALILMLCKKTRAEAVLGDLQERFEGDVASVGRHRAQCRYWFRTLRSVGPLLMAKLRNWGAIAALVELGRRFIGS